MNRLIILGASGHGKVCADIAKENGYTDIAFIDDNENITECAGYPVIGKTEDEPKYDGDRIIAIGNAKIRQRLMEKIKTVSLIHPKAIIGNGVEIGEGTVIMPGAVINHDAKIGKGCIINTCSSVDHDCVIDDYVHIAVGAHLCGTVHVGKSTWVGAGSIVRNNISICSDCMIGAGAVVVSDIERPATYIGVPAKPITPDPGKMLF